MKTWTSVSDGYPPLGTWCYVLCTSPSYDPSGPLLICEDIYADLADDAPYFIWSSRPVLAWLPFPSPDDTVWRHDEPPLDTEVLVLRADGGYGTDTRCVFAADNRTYWRLSDDVAAWMPIPEIPAGLEVRA